VEMENFYEESGQERGIDYLINLRMLGRQRFLELYGHPVLVENYRVPSSRKSVFQLRTMVLGEIDNGRVPVSGESDVLQAKVLAVAKRDLHTPEHMIFVGRAQSNDVVIFNRMVSKLHAYFCRMSGGDQYHIVDMNSANGTYLNGEKLLPGVRVGLRDGDELAFGPEVKVSFFSAAGFCDLVQHLG